MKVFISWSGDQSKALASAIKGYLPLIIQSVDTWFSPEDIDKGARWLADLSTQLQSQSVAVVCVTPESALSPWLLFEVGALSKALDTSWVCPVLLGVEPSELTGPLAQFQSTRLTFDDMRRLLGTINSRIANPLTDKQIDTLHGLLWPEFSKTVAAIPSMPTRRKSEDRRTSDMVAELLDTVRSLDRKVSELSQRAERTQMPAPNEYIAVDHMRQRLKELRRKQNTVQKELSVVSDYHSKTPPEEINVQSDLMLKIQSLSRLLSSVRAEADRIEAKVQQLGD